jgi:ribosomal-protein-alanine N-acetyltransferase
MRIYLRRPTEKDAEECIQRAKESVSFHRPWIFPSASLSDFMAYLDRSSTPRHRGYLVCRKSDDRIAGVVNLNEIIRGALHGAFVGYWGHAGFCGDGLMTEGLAHVFDDAFDSLGLHRLEVNIQPGNGRSIALVKRLGLVQEGFSRSYLKIAGEWRDHQRWALVESDWRAAGGACGVLESLGLARKTPSK